MPHFVHAADIHLDRSLPALLDGGATHPFALAPRLAFARRPDSLFDYRFEDIQFLDYQSHPHIKAPVAV